LVQNFARQSREFSYGRAVRRGLSLRRPWSAHVEVHLVAGVAFDDFQGIHLRRVIRIVDGHVLSRQRVPMRIVKPKMVSAAAPIAEEVVFIERLGQLGDKMVVAFFVDDREHAIEVNPLAAPLVGRHGLDLLEERLTGFFFRRA